MIRTDALIAPRSTSLSPVLSALSLLLLLCAATAFAAARPERSSGQHGLSGRPLVVGYFGQWGVYDHFFVRNLVTSGAVQQLDQLNYAQGFVTDGHCSVADPNADLSLAFSAADSLDGVADDPAKPFHGNLHQLVELKRRFPRLKILLSLEGHAEDFAADAQPAAREAFVRSCVDTFLRGHLAPGIEALGLFDGIDIDWEYPHEPDAANFLALLHEFRRQMNAVRPGLRLAIAVGPSPRMVGGADLPAISRLVDQVGIMNYDYNGPWNPRTGFLAPLYIEEGHGGSVERSLRDWEAAGVPAPKLLLGLPFYGYGWQQVPATSNGLQQLGHSIRGDRPYPFFQQLMQPPAASTPAAPRSATPEPAPGAQPTSAATTQPNRSQAAGTAPSTTLVAAPSTLPAAGPASSSEPAEKLLSRSVGSASVNPPPFILYRDPHSKAPWLFDGSTFWTYEDPTSIRTKAAFARAEHLGGVMAWELSEDSVDSALLKAAHLGLSHPVPAERQLSPKAQSAPSELRQNR